MVAYGEFRAPFKDAVRQDPPEGRFVFYGMRFFIETYMNKKWTLADVDAAAQFYATHNAAFTPYPYPKDLFTKYACNFVNGSQCWWLEI